MEISPQIDKLLKSNNKDDQKIALEILKANEYEDFETFIYTYRFFLHGWNINEYFNYQMEESKKPCLSALGILTETALKIKSWKKTKA